MTRHTIAALACLASAVFGSAGLTAQSTTETLSISASRPIANAVETLERKYGWVITYEDPEYQNLSDFKDVTAAVRPAASFSDTREERVIVPRGGMLNFKYSVTNGKPTEDVTHLLVRLLKSYGT